MAIGVVEGGVVTHVRTDHIGRPVFATDGFGVKVWEASYLPFGGVHTSTGANSDLRFPGQWFQSESGLHQNWMRDYDPTTGRYVQADPLGLVDGASVYGYARQSPLRYVDPRGLFLEEQDTVDDPPIHQPFPGSGGSAGPGGPIPVPPRPVRVPPIAIPAAAAAAAVALLPWIPNVPDEFAEEECDDDCNPATAPFWNSLKSFRGEYRYSGNGRRRLYYKWDRAHFCEVEVYNRRGQHLGAVDGRTGAPIKPAEPGRVERGLR